MTARSGTSSSSSSVATASIPPTTSAVACTTLTRPLNDSRRWARIRRPGDVSSRSAPITTTCDGCEDRAQRPHGGAPVAQVGVVLQEVVGGQIELDAHDAVLEPVPMHQPDGAEHPQHRHVPGKGVGDQATEPGGPSDQRQILQQHRRHALVVVGVGDGEGDLGLDPAWPGVVLADADDRTVGLGDQRDLLVDVLDRGSLQLVIGDERPQAEEPGVRGRVVELLVEGPQPLDITRAGGAHMNRPARRQQDVALERREQRRRGRRRFVRRHLPDRARHRHPPCPDTASQAPWTAHRRGQSVPSSRAFVRCPPSDLVVERQPLTIRSRGEGCSGRCPRNPFPSSRWLSPTPARCDRSSGSGARERSGRCGRRHQVARALLLSSRRAPARGRFGAGSGRAASAVSC